MFTRAMSLRSPTPHAMLAIALLGGAAVAPSGAQMCGWESHEPPGPVGRISSAAAYDSHRGVTVMFGGEDDNNRLGDTWELHDLQWSAVATGGPTPRYGHAMAFDSRRGVTVLFGGSDATRTRGDTWEWNGGQWSRVATSGPSARAFHTMAYDPVRGVTVLFGGLFDLHGLGDTWEWDGSRWDQVADGGPSARSSAAMTFNPLTNRVALFGGDSNSSRRNDLWEWDGVAWQHISTGGPEPRRSHGMAFDEKRGVLVVFGGFGVYSGLLRDTWIWTGLMWRQFWTPPPLNQTRWGMVMLYDAARGAVLVFSGAPGGLSLPRDVSYLECNTVRLFVDASCPNGGALRVGWTGATPRTRVALLYSPRGGRTFIPDGSRCEGTMLGLSAGVQVVASARTSAAGHGTITGRADPSICGGRMQLLDLMFCATSNVVPVE